MYQVQIPAEVQEALRRLQAADPAGAELVSGAVLALAADPRPAGVHVLSEAEGLHRVHLSRVDAGTGRRLQYRVMYQVRDEDLVVLLLTAGALPPASRRRR